MWRWWPKKRSPKQLPSTRGGSLPRSGHEAQSNSSERRDDLAKLERYLLQWLLGRPESNISPSPELLTRLDKHLEDSITQYQLDSLPRQTGVLPKLMRAITKDNVTRQEIARIVLNDPALTDQMLTVANSPYFRPAEHEIESVDSAIFLLGIEGIRSVIAAAVIRPMMMARNRSETRFAQQAWHWGIACARASELMAREQGQDTNGFFITGLLPSLAYLSLYREISSQLKTLQIEPKDAGPVYTPLIQRYSWDLCLRIAHIWELPPRFQAILLEAQRPSPISEFTPLNDGIILATREVLRQARQRNLPEEDLRALLRIPEKQFRQVREQLLSMLQ